MKRAAALFLCVALVLSGATLSFADTPDVTQNYLTNQFKYNGYSFVYYLYKIWDGQSTHNTWLQNIYNAISGSSGTNSILLGISSLLQSTTSPYSPTTYVKKTWDAINATGGLPKESTLVSLVDAVSDNSLSDFFNVNGFNLYRWQIESSSGTSTALGNSDFMKFWVMAINDMEKYFQTNSNSLIGNKYARYNDDLERTDITLYNTSDLSNYAFNDISYYLSRLTYVLANPAEIEARQDMESRTEAIKEDFINSDGDSSVSLSDIGTLRDFSSSVSDLGNFTVSPTRAVDMLQSDAPWEFLTQDTKNDIDPISRPRLLMKSVDNNNNYVYNYLDDNIREIESLIND